MIQGRLSYGHCEKLAHPGIDDKGSGGIVEMRIGIISDTHDLLRPEVLETLQGCDWALHGGVIQAEEEANG